MKLTVIALVLCACVWVAAGDVAHLRSAKARLLGRIVRTKHHKRGVLSSVPPFKLGYDFPVVTHSLVKPLVVSYPPAAAVTAVKVPLAYPLTTRYPVPVGHKVPVPHPHYGLKFPHHTKTVLLPKPQSHFHHHHHHVEPTPLVPVVHGHAPVPAPVPVSATPILPLEPPIETVHAHPVPVPSSPVLLQPSVFPTPSHLFTAQAIASAAHLQPQEHVHLRPAVPAPVPIQPAPAVAPLAPLLPLSAQFPYVLRHGNAVQASFFANYPRYPLLNYQSPYAFAPAPPPPSIGQVLYEHPKIPQYHLVPQVGQEGVVFEQTGLQVPTTLLRPTQAEIHHAHLQPTQPTLHLEPQPGVHLHPDVHLHHDVNLQPAQPEVHLQHDVHLQPAQPEVHLHSTQPSLIPTQPTVHVQPTQPGIHQIPLEHDGWSPVQPTPHDIAVSQAGAHFGQDAGAHFAHEGQFGLGSQFVQDGNLGQSGHHQFTQEQGTQVYEHHSGEGQYNFQDELQHHIQQQIEQAQYEQHLNNHQHQQTNVPQDSYGVPIINQEYGQPNQDFGHSRQNLGQGQNFGEGQSQFSQLQPAGEYGIPQGAEGRSAEGDDDALYHNHIPLKLQVPLEKPLEHFQR